MSRARRMFKAMRHLKAAAYHAAQAGEILGRCYEGNCVSAVAAIQPPVNAAVEAVSRRYATTRYGEIDASRPVK